MRKLLFLMLSLISVSVFAQSAWQQVNIPGMNAGEAVYDIAFLNDNVGIVTTFEWTTYTSYAYITQDGGANWTRASFSNTDATECMMFDANTAVVAGSKLALAHYLRTTDGGLTWTPVSVNGLDSFLGGVAVNDSVGYLTVSVDGFFEEGALQRTTDGGASWTTVWQDSIVPWDVAFSDPQTGSIRGWGAFIGNVLLQTTDGGSTLVLADSSLTEMRGLCMNDAGVGYVARTDSVSAIVKTADYGVSWSAPDTTVFDDIRGTAIHSTEAMLFGPNSLVAFTLDGGTTWVQDNIPSAAHVIAGSYSDSYAYAGGTNASLYRKVVAAGLSNEPLMPASFATVSPNPFTNFFEISLHANVGEQYEIEIFDVSGRKVAESEFAKGEKVRISTRQWPAGVYIYRILADHGALQTGKLLRK